MDKWTDLGEWRRAAHAASSPAPPPPPLQPPAPLVDPLASEPPSTSPPPSKSSSSPLVDADTVNDVDQSLPSHLMIPLDLWQDYIHGLSQVEYHHKSARDLPAWSRATQSERDHLATLDGLALLLVFSSQSDIAAISYWRSADELKLLWAKNTPVDDSSQLEYIEKLLENIKKGTPADELLRIVIPMCKEKIFRRVEKLANSFDASQTDQKRESNLWQVDETKEPYQELEAALRGAGLLEPFESTVQLLDGFTRLVGKVTKTSPTEHFWSILYFSCCVTSIASLNKILGESQVRYLNKLGDYVRILERMPELLKKVGKAQITVEQVLPPAEASIEVLSGTLEILNLRCSHIASDEITKIENWALVERVYGRAQPGRPAVGKKKIRFTQHCEITLALDMLKRTRLIPGHSIIEIGVSKACCEWCCEYLNLLTSAYQRHPILVRASHGKQPDGWMMPPSGPQSISQQMVRLIVERVDDVVWKITSSRRSDSNELPSFTKEADLGTTDQAITKNYSSFQIMRDHS